MQVNLQVTTKPAIEPVTMDMARLHCRIDQAGDDELLAGYVAAARSMVEMYLSRVLITQTLLWTILPEEGVSLYSHRLHWPLILPRSPVQSLVSVSVTDTLGNVTMIPATTLPRAPNVLFEGYIFDAPLARLRVGPDTVLSDARTLRRVELDNIQIQFVAGYGADGAAIPQPILNAILLLTGFLYENRGDVGAEMPRAAEWLLDPYRMMWVT